MKRTKNPQPFIIWTLQRTGGTNLAQRLFERSGLIEAAPHMHAPNAPALRWLEGLDSQWKLHEPFNMGSQDRIFGSASEHWSVTQDRKALDRSVDEICSLHLPMKHCVEMVPWEISASLARAATRHGYRHLFLYRENGLNRLLSLQFAKLSGVWGPQFLGERQLQEKIFEDPLPVNDLLEHETSCNELLVKAWRLMYTLGSDPVAVKFEAIYEAETPEAGKAMVLSMLEFLDLSEDAQGDDRFAAEMVTHGNQGTRDEYSNFKGIPALQEGLRKLKRPPLASRFYPVDVKTTCSDQPMVVHAALDLLPKTVHPGFGFDVGGVLVVKENLLDQAGIYALTENTERRVQWGIPSPAVAKQFGSELNSHSARFKISKMRCRAGEKVDLVLRYGDGGSMPLFQLHVGEQAVDPANRSKS
jgi:hypothetical protein